MSELAIAFGRGLLLGLTLRARRPGAARSAPPRPPPAPRPVSSGPRYAGPGVCSSCSRWRPLFRSSAGQACRDCLLEVPDA